MYAFVMSLMNSCYGLNPYTIDSDQAELIRVVNDEDERISCFDDRVDRITCFDEKDLNIINKCIRKCKEKDK